MKKIKQLLFLFALLLAGVGFTSLQAQSASPVVTTQPTCAAPNAGVITVTLLGGVNFPYAITVGGQSEQLSSDGWLQFVGFSAGTYPVTVTDNTLTVILTSSVTVTEAAITLLPIKIMDATLAHPTCALPNSGAITLNTAGFMTGGSGFYTYLWSNGETTANLTALTAGEYTVTINDARCTQVEPITKSFILASAEYPALNVQVDTKLNPDCANNNGEIVISATGGTGNYTYVWAHDAAITDGNAGDDLAAGTYIVTVSDPDCDAVAPVVLTITLEADYNLVKIDLIEKVDPTCPAGNDGRIVVAVSGGNGTYTYTWTDDAGATISTTDKDLIDIPAGIYNLLVEADGTSCSAKLTNIILTDPVMIDVADYVKVGDLVYGNGQPVSAINLLSNPLPEGYVIEWIEDTSVFTSTIGLSATSGGGEIPGFVATYKEGGVNTATIEYTISYVGCTLTSPLTGSFDITVYPLTVEDLGLSLNQLDNETICFNVAAAAPGFTAVILAPVHATETLDTDEVSYLVEYVSGAQVVDLSAVPAKGDLIWDVTASGISGTGVYSITPIWNNGLGIPSVVTFTVQPQLSIDDMDLKGKTLTYQNGEQVAAIVLNGGSLPAGANVVWAITGISGGDDIGTGEYVSAIATDPTSWTLRNVIPAFTAVNTNEDDTPVIVQYSFYIEYDDCDSGHTSSDLGTFTMVVTPKKIGDMNLLVNEVIDITKCYEEALGSLTFTAQKSNEDPLLFDATKVSYRIEFVSGAPVLTLAPLDPADPPVNVVTGSNPWTLPQANPKVSGTGTYRVTPVYNSFEGKSTTFNVTVRPQLLVSDVSQYSQTMVVQNGDMINEIDFTGNIPAGAKVVWSLLDPTNSNIGSAITGVNVIPQFRAYSPVMGSATTVKAEYEFSLKYEECNSLTVGKFTINVEPKKIDDPNLVANPVAGQTICFEDAFSAINLTAEKDNANPVFDATEAAKVEYVVEFVSGTQVIDLATQPTVGGSAWTPAKLAGAVGTGTYRVTPYYNSGSGLSALFTLTVQPELLVQNLHMNGQVLTYQNGDMVDAIVLTGNIPEGAIVNWNQIALIDENGNDAFATYGINSIGSVAGGQNVVPAFTATNTLNATIAPFTLIATFSLDIAYEGCVSNVGQFQIKVEANTIGDLDLVMKPVISQIECDGLAFDEVELEAYRTDGQPFAGIGMVEYIIEFVDGVDVLNLGSSYIEREVAGTAAMWQPILPAVADQVSGKGRYRVTPRWNNNEGKSAIFTLTFYKAFDNNNINIDDLFSVNDLRVPEFKLSAPSLPEGAKIRWQKVSGDYVGLDLDEGIDIIPSFVAFNENANGANTVANYEAWVEYPDCEPTSPITKKFSIIVRAKTVKDDDLKISSVLNQVVCYDEPFENILLSAGYRFPMDWDLQNAQPGDLVFEWAKIDGDNIIDPLAADGVLYVPVGTGSFSAEWDLSAATAQTVGSGTYQIQPIWANRFGAITTVTLTRLARPTAVQVKDYVLCNNSSLTDVELTSKFKNVKLYWEVVDANGDAIQSQLGIPANGTDKFVLDKLVNASATHITEYIKVTPTFTTQGNSGQNAECPGIPMTFAITVLPTPAADKLPNVVYEHDQAVAATPFTGFGFTTFVWEIENADIAAPGTPTKGEGFELPAFTTNNTDKDQKPVSSTIKVVPVYDLAYAGGKTIRCEGEPMTFSILVASKPTINAIADVKICEGQDTEIITPSGLPLSNTYFITWESERAPSFGLDNNLDQDALERRWHAIPSFKVREKETEDFAFMVPDTIPVTVTPWITIDGKDFTKAYPGDAVTFNYIIMPKAELAARHKQGEISIDYCTGEGNDIVMQVEAIRGYDLKYQWYKDGRIIDNDDARNATYTIKSNHVDASSIGTYYVVVTGQCNSVTSVDFVVRATIVHQNYYNVMTLYTDPETNGGIDFIGRKAEYQWYELKAGEIEGTIVAGEGKSYLYMGEGLEFTAGSKYYVVAKFSNGDIYTSCPLEARVGEKQPTVSVYPNPVKIGETITVKIENGAANGRVEMYDASGSLRTSKVIEGETTLLTMDNDPGIYLIRVTTGDQGAKEFKVIVK